MVKAAKREQVVLEAALRQGKGKGPAGALRVEGLVPGVVYGEGQKPLLVQLPVQELRRILHTKAGGNALITLRLDDTKGERAVLIKELQHDPVSHQIIHVDFHHVSLSKAIKVEVPLSLKGADQALGVKQDGGIIEHLRWELEVECLPTEIPAELELEVSGLALNQSLHAKDVPLPAGVKLVTDPEQPVVSCVLPRVEVVAAPAEGAEAAPTEPEVLKQKKPEEIAAAEAEKGEKSKEQAKEKEQGKKPAPEGK